MDEVITLAHGGGGTATSRLIERVILPRLGNPLLDPLEDAARLELSAASIAFTTDSFVVRPRFFPGGDLGKLAVCGTVNDLAVMGARPLYLSLGLILEEGLPIEELERLLDSLAAEAAAAGVTVVTGDTKVVARGEADGVFINTAGIGVFDAAHPPFAGTVRPGDRLLVSGALGDHGLAVLSARESLPLRAPLVSDCASLFGLVEALRAAGEVRWMRDCTRGGLAAAANELAVRRQVALLLEEDRLVFHSPAKALAELLGFDLLTVANEGVLLAVIAPDNAERVLAAARAHPLGVEAALIGEVLAGPAGEVALSTAAGGRRLIEPPLGELLPRIC